MSDRNSQVSTRNVVNKKLFPNWIVAHVIKSSLSLRFGVCSCSIWAIYTSFESSQHIDLDYLSFGSNPLRCVGHSIRRTVEIEPAALWYHFVLTKSSYRINIVKTLLLNYLVRTYTYHLVGLSFLTTSCHWHDLNFKYKRVKCKYNVRKLTIGDYWHQLST